MSANQQCQVFQSERKYWRCNFFILNFKKNTNHLGNEPVMQWFSSVAHDYLWLKQSRHLTSRSTQRVHGGGGEHWLDSTMFVFVFSIKYFIVYIRQTTLHLLNPSHYIFEKQHETKLSSVTRTVCKTMTWLNKPRHTRQNNCRLSIKLRIVKKRAQK